jgi:hypothetical protein
LLAQAPMPSRPLAPPGRRTGTCVLPKSLDQRLEAGSASSPQPRAARRWAQRRSCGQHRLPALERASLAASVRNRADGPSARSDPIRFGTPPT